MQVFLLCWHLPVYHQQFEYECLSPETFDPGGEVTYPQVPNAQQQVVRVLDLNKLSLPPVTLTACCTPMVYCLLCQQLASCQGRRLADMPARPW